MRIQDPLAYVLLPMNSEVWSPLSGSEDPPCQQPQSNGGSIMGAEVSNADDSGVSERYPRRSCSSRNLYSISLMDTQGSLVHPKLAYVTLASRLHPAAEPVLLSWHVPRSTEGVLKLPSASLHPVLSFYFQIIQKHSQRRNLRRRNRGWTCIW